MTTIQSRTIKPKKYRNPQETKPDTKPQRHQNDHPIHYNVSSMLKFKECYEKIFLKKKYQFWT